MDKLISLFFCVCVQLMCVGATIAGSVALAKILHIDGIVIAPGFTLSYVIDLFNSPDIHTKTEATAALAVVSFAPIILILPLSIVTNVLHLVNNNLGILRKILVIFVRNLELWGYFVH